MKKLERNFLEDLRTKISAIDEGAKLEVKFHSSDEINIRTIENHAVLYNGCSIVDNQGDNFYDNKENIDLEDYIKELEVYLYDKPGYVNEVNCELTHKFLVTYLETMCYAITHNLVDYWKGTLIKEKDFIINQLFDVLDKTTRTSNNVIELLDNEYTQLIGRSTINKIIETIVLNVDNPEIAVINEKRTGGTMFVNLERSNCELLKKSIEEQTNLNFFGSKRERHVVNERYIKMPFMLRN